MNVEIGTEAALFPEKEYISGIFIAVQVFPWQGLSHGIQSLHTQELIHGRENSHIYRDSQLTRKGLT
jgi:hypothetical protein